MYDAEWDVKYTAVISEALENGLSITEVDGKPLKLKEMWAFVKLKNGADTSVWMGCTIKTDADQDFAGTTSGHGGIYLGSGGYAYFMYHAYKPGGSEDRFVVDVWANTSGNVGGLSRQTNRVWMSNWVGFYQTKYIRGLVCQNNLGAGGSTQTGTEIMIWGKSA